jgi:hypothetical protein
MIRARYARSDSDQQISIDKIEPLIEREVAHSYEMGYEEGKRRGFTIGLIFGIIICIVILSCCK